MSLWFDETKGRWRIRIRRAGVEIARTLPPDVAKRQAREIHHKLMNQVLPRVTRNNQLRLTLSVSDEEIAAWRAEVDRAFSDPESWLLQLHKTVARRHIRKQYNGGAIDAISLKTLALRCRGRCEVSGLKLNVPRTGPILPSTASLDRIDSTKGYLEGNCRFVALAVNLAMQRWGDEAFRKICYGVVVREYF